MKIPNQCITETFYDNEDSNIMTNFYCFKTKPVYSYNHTNPLTINYLSETLYDKLINTVSINKRSQKYQTKKKEKTRQQKRQTKRRK
jgi:hypothetical protein